MANISISGAGPKKPTDHNHLNYSWISCLKLNTPATLHDQRVHAGSGYTVDAKTLKVDQQWRLMHIRLWRLIAVGQQLLLPSNISFNHLWLPWRWCCLCLSTCFILMLILQEAADIWFVCCNIATLSLSHGVQLLLLTFLTPYTSLMIG